MGDANFDAVRKLLDDHFQSPFFRLRPAQSVAAHLLAGGDEVGTRGFVQISLLGKVLHSRSRNGEKAEAAEKLQLSPFGLCIHLRPGLAGSTSQASRQAAQ